MSQTYKIARSQICSSYTLVRNKWYKTNTDTKGEAFSMC